MNVTENGVCMLSLSRVNISHVSSTLEPGLQVCMGHRHENGGELSEGGFRV